MRNPFHRIEELILNRLVQNDNFYRKMEDHIKGVTDNLVICDLEILDHEHLNLN